MDDNNHQNKSAVPALISRLRKTAATIATLDELPPETLSFYQDMRDALAAILEQQVTISDSLDRANETLEGVLETLGGPPTLSHILEPFEKINQTIRKNVPFNIYEKAPGKGALIWAIFDISSPSCKFSFRFDSLLWEFRIDTLISQGIDHPLFPGVWLTKADSASGHYCLLFSAGSFGGFSFKNRMIISVTYDGTADSATLYEARGIKWDRG